MLCHGRLSPIIVLFIVALVGCHGPDNRVNPFAGGSASLTLTGKDISDLASRGVGVARSHLDEPQLGLVFQQLADTFERILERARNLTDQAAAVKAAEAKCQRVMDENQKLKDDLEKKDRAFWFWFRIVCIIVFLGGMGIAYYFPKAAPVAGIVGGGGIALSNFMLSYGWVVNLITGGLVVTGGVLVVLAMLHKFKIEQRRMDADQASAQEEAERTADMARHALDGKATLKEFIATLRTGWKELDAAMSSHRAAPAKDGNSGHGGPGA